MLQQILLVDGHCYTGDTQKPFVQAIFINGDRIMATGDTQDLWHYKTANTKVINLEGRFVIPGLIESHGHLLSTGQLQQFFNITGFTSLKQVTSELKNFIDKNSHLPWIKGRGWDQNLWTPQTLPTHHSLSGIAPDLPVALTRIDGHALWVNAKAMQLANITKHTKEIDGGKIVRDRQGEPTGILIDNAMSLVENLIPKDLFNDDHALQRGLEDCIQAGITTFCDADVGSAELAAMKKSFEEKKLPLRLYSILRGSDESLCEEHFSHGPQILGDHRLQIRGIKLYADGALGSCGAALFESYENDPENTGLLLLSEEEIFQKTFLALKHHFQVCTHAIGDLANHIVLNGYEKALKKMSTVPDHRLRIEHAQMVRPADIPRFSQLGVIASVQPGHCTADLPWMEDRIGIQRSKSSGSPWRSFLDHGVLLAGGSDTPIEPLNPLWGIYAAISRKNREGYPVNGWYPEQKLTSAEALFAYTQAGALASFNEKHLGELRPGHLADLVILSHNILDIPPEEILQTQVLATMIGGTFEFCHPDNFFY